MYVLSFTFSVFVITVFAFDVPSERVGRPLTNNGQTPLWNLYQNQNMANNDIKKLNNMLQQNYLLKQLGQNAHLQIPYSEYNGAIHNNNPHKHNHNGQQNFKSINSGNNEVTTSHINNKQLRDKLLNILSKTDIDELVKNSKIDDLHNVPDTIHYLGTNSTEENIDDLNFVRLNENSDKDSGTKARYSIIGIHKTFDDKGNEQSSLNTISQLNPQEYSQKETEFLNSLPKNSYYYVLVKYLYNKQHPENDVKHASQAELNMNNLHQQSQITNTKLNNANIQTITVNSQKVQGTPTLNTLSNKDRLQLIINYLKSSQSHSNNENYVLYLALQVIQDKYGIDISDKQNPSLTEDQAAYALKYMREIEGNEVFYTLLSNAYEFEGHNNIQSNNLPQKKDLRDDNDAESFEVNNVNILSSYDQNQNVVNVGENNIVTISPKQILTQETLINVNQNPENNVSPLTPASNIADKSILPNYDDSYLKVIGLLTNEAKPTEDSQTPAQNVKDKLALPFDESVESNFDNNKSPELEEQNVQNDEEGVAHTIKTKESEETLTTPETTIGPDDILAFINANFNVDINTKEHDHERGEDVNIPNIDILNILNESQSVNSTKQPESEKPAPLKQNKTLNRSTIKPQKDSDITFIKINPTTEYKTLGDVSQEISPTTEDQHLLSISTNSENDKSNLLGLLLNNPELVQTLLESNNAALSIPNDEKPEENITPLEVENSPLQVATNPLNKTDVLSLPIPSNNSNPVRNEISFMELLLNSMNSAASVLDSDKAETNNPNIGTLEDLSPISQDKTTPLNPDDKLKTPTLLQSIIEKLNIPTIETLRDRVPVIQDKNGPLDVIQNQADDIKPLINNNNSESPDDTINLMSLLIKNPKSTQPEPNDTKLNNPSIQTIEDHRPIFDIEMESKPSNDEHSNSLSNPIDVLPLPNTDTKPKNNNIDIIKLLIENPELVQTLLESNETESILPMIETLVNSGPLLQTETSTIETQTEQAPVVLHTEEEPIILQTEKAPVLLQTEKAPDVLQTEEPNDELVNVLPIDFSPIVTQSDEQNVLQTEKAPIVNQSDEPNVLETEEAPIVNQSDELNLLQTEKAPNVLETDEPNVLQTEKAPNVLQTDEPNVLQTEKAPEVIEPDEPNVLQTEKAPIVIQPDEPNVLQTEKAPNVLQTDEPNILQTDEPNVLQTEKAPIVIQPDEPNVLQTEKAPNVLQTDEPNVLQTEKAPEVIEPDEPNVLQTEKAPVVIEPDEPNVLQTEKAPIVIQPDEPNVLQTEKAPNILQTDEPNVLQTEKAPNVLQTGEPNVLQTEKAPEEIEPDEPNVLQTEKAPLESNPTDNVIPIITVSPDEDNVKPVNDVNNLMKALNKYGGIELELPETEDTEQSSYRDNLMILLLNMIQANQENEQQHYLDTDETKTEENLNDDYAQQLLQKLQNLLAEISNEEVVTEPASEKPCIKQHDLDDLSQLLSHGDIKISTMEDLNKLFKIFQLYTLLHDYRKLDPDSNKDTVSGLEEALAIRINLLVNQNDEDKLTDNDETIEDDKPETEKEKLVEKLVDYLKPQLQNLNQMPDNFATNIIDDVTKTLNAKLSDAITDCEVEAAAEMVTSISNIINNYKNNENCDRK